MVPGQGAASGTRSQGSARVAAGCGEPDAAPRASAAQRVSAELGTALLPPGWGRGGEGPRGRRCPLPPRGPPERPWLQPLQGR